MHLNKIRNSKSRFEVRAEELCKSEFVKRSHKNCENSTHGFDRSNKKALGTTM